MNTKIQKDAPPAENGSVTFLFIALLAIMLMLVMANVRTIVQLRMEEKLVEQKQVSRLAAMQTNTVSVHTPGAQ